MSNQLDKKRPDGSSRSANEGQQRVRWRLFLLFGALLLLVWAVNAINNRATHQKLETLERRIDVLTHEVERVEQLTPNRNVTE